MPHGAKWRARWRELAPEVRRLLDYPPPEPGPFPRRDVVAAVAMLVAIGVLCAALYLWSTQGGTP